jgi:dTDP-4-amino-4,6-dideoxygalactose transaminase/RimJ/RimL family protein N-acetyltransferase
MSDVRLRRADMGDAERVFRWRNDPSIVAKGLLQRPVAWEEHAAWFRETVEGDSRILFILEDRETAVGQVRFDRESETQAAISVYLAPGLTGRGLGVPGIRRGCWEAFRRWDIRTVIARVRAENAAARRAFEKADFRAPDAGAVDSQADYLFARPADVPHNRLTWGSEESAAVSGVVASGHWAESAKVGEFESALAAVAGRRAVVCVGSGLGALRLALLSRGVGPGHAVIVPAYSCVALANAVLATGAVPVPVDVTAGDWNIDPEQAGGAKTPSTRTVIAVHTFGRPARIDAVRELGVAVIEDCAHALGVTQGGRPLGSLGTVSISSFYATKLIGAGEGGAVFTDDDEAAAFVRRWRDYVDQPPCGTRLNDKMTDLEAALGLAQLARLGRHLEARRRIAARYLEELGRLRSQIGGFTLPDDAAGRVWYRFAVELTCCDAREIIEEMRGFGVAAEQPVSNWLGEARIKDFPVAARAFASLVSLPLYPTLTEDEQERVCYAFAAALARRCRT